MARFFRDSTSSSRSSSDLAAGADASASAATTAASSRTPPLPSPFPDLGVPLSAAELRATAYEVLVAASRATGAKPLTYIPQSAASAASAAAPAPSLSSSIHRSLASTAAASSSKVKKALGLRRSSASSSSKRRGARRPATVAELVRVQLGVTEQADARIRRALLRIAAGQVGISVTCLLKCSIVYFTFFFRLLVSVAIAVSVGLHCTGSQFVFVLVPDFD